MSGVRDIDLGLRRFVAGLGALREGVRVTIGVHEDSGAKDHPSGGTVATVATVLEFGTDRRAPLGWLRNTIDERRAALARGLADAGARVLYGELPAQAFTDIANETAVAMRERVPVDTGTVRESIEARVDGVRVG